MVPWRPAEHEYLHGTIDYNQQDGSEDLDGDGLGNSQEFFAGTDPHDHDTDMDGIPDGDDLYPTDRTRALDSDSDGLPDAWEIVNGFDPMMPFDAQMDDDGDGLSLLEEYLAGTDWRLQDSDADGAPDADDLYPNNALYQIDDDNDGLPNAYEDGFSFLYPFDPLDATQDNDQDGLNNLQEFQLGTDPSEPDSDADGFFDGDDVAPTDPQYAMDSDQDGLPDQWEFANGFDAFRHDSFEDMDNDRLSNRQEYQLGTDPNNPDTDNDYMSDGEDHYPLNPQYSFKDLSATVDLVWPWPLYGNVKFQNL